jgi:hypothetical protein
MRSIREAESEVERLRAAWKDWQGALDVDSLLARQLLRKVLDGPIRVFPAGKGRWEFKGESRFDGLFGSIGRREHVGIGTGSTRGPRRPVAQPGRPGRSRVDAIRSTAG